MRTSNAQLPTSKFGTIRPFTSMLDVGSWKLNVSRLLLSDEGVAHPRGYRNNAYHVRASLDRLSPATAATTTMGLGASTSTAGVFDGATTTTARAFTTTEAWLLR